MAKISMFTVWRTRAFNLVKISKLLGVARAKTD
jgi:hypothetical protein